MSGGLTKYRQQLNLRDEHADPTQDRKRKKKKIEEPPKQQVDSYADKVVISLEAEEKLSTELLQQENTSFDDTDDDIVEKVLEGKVTVEIKSFDVIKNPQKEPREKLGTKEEIIREYASLIKYIAKKIAARLPPNIELDDLISSGVIGLMDAIDKYDPSRDNKFKTYAEFRIRGAILDELRAQDWVPRSVREKAKMLERAYTKLEHENGHPATDEEVCAYLNITQDEYHDLLNQVRSVSLLSYDDLSSLAKSDRRMLMGLSESGKTTNPFSEVNSAHVKKVVSQAISDLPEKQRLVLSLYYYEDLNLKEIGKVLDVTESRVSQLHTQAILRLRGKLKSHIDDFTMLFA